MPAGVHPDLAASKIASAIGEPARARMLYCLMDRHARTSTELAAVANVSASTASVHLHRLREARLVKVHAQGKHRYYALGGREIAAVLEGLSVVAGASASEFVPHTPTRLCAARTCYDHTAGVLGVVMCARFEQLRWITVREADDRASYEVTAKGQAGFGRIGVDVAAVRLLRRRFAYMCLDWSERRPHLGGGLGAAVLESALRRRWVSQDGDSRALTVTARGRREMLRELGLQVCSLARARWGCA